MFLFRLLFGMAVAAMLALLAVWSQGKYFGNADLSGTNAICVAEIDRYVGNTDGSSFGDGFNLKLHGEWERVGLPNDWLTFNYGRKQEVYRYKLDLNVPPNRLWGIYYPAVNLNVETYVNGSQIGVEGRMEEPIAQNNFRPLYFSIPNGLLNSGTNELHLRVVSFPPGHGFLGRFCLGPEPLLKARYERKRLLTIEYARFLSMLTFVFGAVMFVIWLLRRSDREYGWLALTMFFWLAHSLKFHVANIPFSSLAWGYYLYLSSLSTIYAAALFMMSFRRSNEPVARRFAAIAWSSSAVGLTILYLLESQFMYRFAEIALAVAVLFISLQLIRGIVLTQHRRSAEVLWLSYALTFVVVVMISDSLLISGFIDRVSGQSAVIALPVLLSAFSLIMIRRFIFALSEREELLRNLEQRAVAGAARIVDLEKETALAEQRETIMRDMHDGVGGHLVSVLAAIERPDVAPESVKEVIQGALVDLRLMIDSLDIDSGDLSMLIGALRDRMQRVLASAGLQSSWTVEAVPEVPGMNPHKSLQVVRIVQEAIANVVKHAEGDQIDIRLFHDTTAGGVTVVVADNGKGFSDVRGNGHGLKNMRARAQEIGAVLNVFQNEVGGTTVSLFIPTSTAT